MNISGTPEKLGQYLAQRIEQMVRPPFLSSVGLAAFSQHHSPPPTPPNRFAGIDWIVLDWYNQRYSMVFSVAGNGLKMQKIKKLLRILLPIVSRNCSR